MPARSESAYDGHHGDADPAPGLRHGFTWLNEAPTPKVIEDFIKHWYPKHWYDLAQCAKELIERKLKESELQAIVTCRAKQEDNLRRKLKLRHETIKNYRDEKEISDDLYDLAGVRIILIVSTPEQREKVKSIIESIWGPGVIEKLHEGTVAQTSAEGSDPNNQYRAKHIGYEAVHYRPSMKKEQETSDYMWRAGDRVEVQVVSALANAWAEAGHDVLYKTHAYGDPSLEERRILDALNGFVRSGELLLEQFHEAFMRRTKKKWEHQNQLGTYLQEVDILRKGAEGGRPEFDSAGIDILFLYLKQTGRHYPLAVRNALINIGFGKGLAQVQVDGIISRLEPAELEIADHMRIALCLIWHFMGENKAETENLCPYRRSVDDMAPNEVPNCISIMMTALIILQDFLGEFYKASQLLSRVDMNEAEIRSLKYILEDIRRQTVLEADKSEEESVQRVFKIAKLDIEPLWNWFLRQSKDENSIFRLCFQLAQIKLRSGNLQTVSLLERLRIPPISPVNTFSNEEDDPEFETEDRNFEILDMMPKSLLWGLENPGSYQGGDKAKHKESLLDFTDWMRKELEKRETQLRELEG